VYKAIIFPLSFLNDRENDCEDNFVITDRKQLPM
jgi:hypothetical protein